MLSSKIRPKTWDDLIEFTEAKIADYKDALVTWKRSKAQGLAYARNAINKPKRERGNTLFKTAPHLVVQFDFHRLAIGSGLWETVGMSQRLCECENPDLSTPLGDALSKCRLKANRNLHFVVASDLSQRARTSAKPLSGKASHAKA